MRQPRSLWMELAVEIAAFLVLVSCVSLLWRYNLLLLVVMVVFCGVALAAWHTRIDICFFLVIAVLGSLAEAVFVHFGVWEYANPTLFGVPIWFPLAFGTTGLIGGRLARTMMAIWEQASPARGAGG
jgi:uncharacterized membrane protein YoaT (DUF817 family)